MKKALSVLLLTLTIVLSFAGCVKDTDSLEVKTEDGEKLTDEVSLTEETMKDEYYPVTITNYNKSKMPIEITFEKRPERVVAVYQNSIETLLALGVEDCMVATSGLDHELKPQFQTAFDSIKYYESGISKEEMMGLNPDFIVSWSSYFGEKQLGDVPFWHDRGVNTYMMMNSGAIEGNRTLENEYQDIRNLGIIFNAQEKAEKIISEIKGEVEKGKNFASEREPVRAVVIEAKSDGTFRVYGENSVGGDMATQMGAELVAKESGTIGAEDLVALNPDVIFTVYYAYHGGSVEEDQALARINEAEGLNSISAIQKGRVHPMMLGEVYCSGIRTMDGVQTMLKGLYPDEYTE